MPISECWTFSWKKPFHPAKCGLEQVMLARQSHPGSRLWTRARCHFYKQTKPACQKRFRNQVPESIPRPNANLAIFPFLWGYCCLTLSSSHPRIDQKSLKQLGLSKLSISMASESSQEINQKWLSSRSPKCHLDRRDNQSLRGCLKKQKRNTQINNVLT